MKKTVFVILFSCVYITSYSQKINITGTVIEADSNQKLEYATIILKPADKSTITGGITDSKGKFDVQIKKGTYHVLVEFISYETKDLGAINFKKDTNLGTITLNISAESLDEVEIIAEKSTVEIRLDKKIYNVGKDMTVKGGTASDVLDNVPSVTVDVEGVVSLRGNENVRILINGKPSNFSRDEALRQLPADAIKKIEVITSPSARYDAEGTAGIINIILRKGKAQGLNGTLNLNGYNFEGYGVSTNFNIRTKKFNFFNTSGYSKRDAPGNAIFQSQYFQQEENPFAIENKIYDRLNKNFHTRFGTTYLISDKSSVTGSVSYFKRNRVFDIAINLSRLNSDFVETGFSTQTEQEKSKNNQLEYNFNFTQKFKTNGHKLSLDFRYETEDNEELATIKGEEIFPNPIIKPQNNTNVFENTKNILLQGNYVLPIKKEAQFEAGFKIIKDNLETDYLLFEEQLNGSFILNTDISNFFVFNQEVLAFYTQYGNKFGKISALFGLRVEDTNIKIVSQGVTNPKNYTELFPTVNLAYEIKEGEDLTLGYNRRIRRPRSYFLNPFSSRANESNIFQGNPNLDPAYTNGVDLGYLKKKNKLTFNTSLYYNYTTDVFQFVREDTGELTDLGVPIIRRSPKNVASENRFGWEFSINYKLFKWWRLNTNFNFYQVARNGKNVIPNTKNNSWNTRFNSRIKLPLKIDWQTTLNHRGSQENFQSFIKDRTSVNLALSKDVFKEKATLSLNISDLFNTRKRRSTTFIEDFSNTYSEFQWRERQITFSFTYRFNKKKRKRRSTKKSIRFSDDG